MIETCGLLVRERTVTVIQTHVSLVGERAVTVIQCCGLLIGRRAVEVIQTIFIFWGHVLFQFLCNLQQYCDSAYNKLNSHQKKSS